jgi:hypothetical protein
VTLRMLAVAVPALIGWMLGVVLHFKAARHLQRGGLVARVAAALIGPFGLPRYTHDGYRYRVLALLSTWIGILVSVLLASIS